MLGGIYSSEKCELCSGEMKDNGRNGVSCPGHKKQFAQKLFVKFPPKVFRRFNTYEEAFHFLTGLRFKQDEGTYDERDYQKANPLGFANLTEKYLEIKRETVKHGTINHIKLDLAKAAEYFGEMNVKEIGYGEIEDFLSSRKRRSPAKRDITSRPTCTPSSFG